jgi:hypothetical protein
MEITSNTLNYKSFIRINLICVVKVLLLSEQSNLCVYIHMYTI